MTVDDAIARYLADLRLGHAPATARTYGVALAAFRRGVAGVELVAQLLDDDPIDFARALGRAAATPVGVQLGLPGLAPDRLRAGVVDHGLSRATARTYSSAVVRFYAWLVRENVRGDVGLERIRLRLRELRGRRARPLPRVPSDQVVDAIAAAARSPASARRHVVRLRNVALIETLRGSGIRVAEAVGLRRADLRPDGSAIVTGKGSRDRVVYFTDAALAAIDDYLGARRDPPRGRLEAPLFRRHDQAAGRVALPLGTEGVRRIVADLVAVADVAGVTPHRFRAWFLTRIVAETGDLDAAQRLAGHASPATTGVYLDVADGRLRDVHRRAFGHTFATVAPRAADELARRRGASA